VALVTKTGPWLYALIAALGLLAVTLTGLVLWGKRGALLTAAIWLACPMSWTLAITEHTHIVSRTCVAFSFLACAQLWRERTAAEAASSRLGWALLLGLSAGYSTATRPYETVAMLGPACIYLGWLGVSRRGVHLRQALVVLLAALPCLLLYGAYNHALTGSPFVTPRAVPWAADADLVQLSAFQRAGQNLGHNFLMLGVWFFGVLGLPLAWCGIVWRDLPQRALRRVLGLGIALQFGVALGHENVGIHVVGPIHYSETAVALTLLTALGALGLSDWFKRASGHPAPLLAGGFGYLVSVVTFGGIYVTSLQGLGRVSDLLPAAVRTSGISNAIVMAQMPCWFERSVPGSHGSWQLAHAPPHPRVDDDVIFVNPDAPLIKLMRAFPTRSIYHAWLNPERTEVEIGLLLAGPTNVDALGQDPFGVPMLDEDTVENPNALPPQNDAGVNVPDTDTARDPAPDTAP
jgi:hypothetical protein